MTTKRTHGPCTCGPTYEPVMMRHAVVSHSPDCPSIYPAQQEPDALTRLARILRVPAGVSLDVEEQALALISEAREEQRKAVDAALADAEAKIRNMARELYATAHSDTLIGGAAGMADAANAIARMRTP